MYGFLIQSAADALRHRYGDDVFSDVCTQAGLPDRKYDFHKMYDEDTIANLATAASKVRASFVDILFIVYILSLF